MSLENLFAHAGDHSILNAVLAVEWNAPIGLDALNAMRDALRSSALQAYPKEDVQQTLKVELSPGGVGGIPQTEIGGYLYSLFSSAGGLLKQVQLTRTNCLFVVADYRRWAEVVDEAAAIFERAIASLPAGAGVGTVGLQYVDRFLWKGNPQELDMAAIFLPQSPYISTHALECKGPWHSHHGYFEESPTPVQHDRLDMINVDVFDEPTGRVIQITTSHRAQLPPETQESAQGSYAKVVVDLHTSLHDVNKLVFKKLLSPALQEKIKLTDAN